jgi:hypothetical protein
MMNVANLKVHGKDLMSTVATNGKIVGLVAGGAILSQKFLDFKEIAAKFTSVETGSTLEKVLDHEGAIKVVGGMAALHFTRNTKLGKNDMFKWVMVGVMLQGAIQEINVLTSDAAGQIGAESEIDKEMKAAAEKIKNGLKGGEEHMGEQMHIGETNPTTQYPTGVSGNPTTEYPTGVSGHAMEDGTGVGAMEGDYDFLHGMHDDLGHDEF